MLDLNGLRVDEATKILVQAGFDKEEYHYPICKPGEATAIGMGALTGASLVGSFYLAALCVKYFQEICKDENDSPGEGFTGCNIAKMSIPLIPFVALICSIAIPVLLARRHDINAKNEVDRINAIRKRAMDIVKIEPDNIKFHDSLSPKQLSELFDATAADKNMWKLFASKMSPLQVCRVAKQLEGGPGPLHACEIRDFLKIYEGRWMSDDLAEQLLLKQNKIKEVEHDRLTDLLLALRSNYKNLQEAYHKCLPLFESEKESSLDKFIINNITIPNCPAVRRLDPKFEAPCDDFYERNKNKIEKANYFALD